MDKDVTKKVLIVEDDPDIARSLEIRLRSLGLDSMIARDAAMATKCAREFQPDLALLDIGLPCGSGFEVAERMRNLVSRDLPLIFMTASRRPNLRETARQFRPVAYFEKPYSSDEVMAAVGAAL